jgi:ABC-type sugar transport system substrate-binding protein
MDLHRTRSGRAALSLAVGSLCIAFAACGGGGGGAAEGSADGAPKSSKDLRVVYSLYDRQAAFFRGCVAGVEAEAKKQGVDLNVAVSGPDATKQIQDLENAIIERPSAIILTSIDAKAVEPTLRKATAAHIPVIALCDEAGAIQREAGPERLSYIGPDYHLTGIKKAEFIVESLKKDGADDGATVAAFFGIRGVPFDVATRAGIDEVMSANPQIKFVKGPYSGEYSADAGLKAAQNVLAGAPDAVGLICDNSDQCMGAVQAVAAAGIKPEDIKVSSDDGIPPELDAIRAGKIDYTVAWCSYNEGELAVQQIVDLLVDGKAPPEYTLDAGRDVTAQGEEVKSAHLASQTVGAGTEATTEHCSEPAFETVTEAPKQQQLEALGLAK